MVHTHLKPPGGVLRLKRLFGGGRELARAPPHVCHLLCQRNPPPPPARSTVTPTFMLPTPPLAGEGDTTNASRQDNGVLLQGDPFIRVLVANAAGTLLVDVRGRGH